MCELSASVALNKETNGQTDIKHEKDVTVEDRGLESFLPRKGRVWIRLDLDFQTRSLRGRTGSNNTIITEANILHSVYRSKI